MEHRRPRRQPRRRPFLWCGAVAGAAIWGAVIPLSGGLGTDDLGGFFLGIGVSGVLHMAYMLVLQRGYRVGNLSTVYATARGSGPFLAVIAAIIVLGERPSICRRAVRDSGAVSIRRSCSAC